MDPKEEHTHTYTPLNEPYTNSLRQIDEKEMEKYV